MGTLTLTVPLSTQVYKWVPAICWRNLTNCVERWTSIPSRGVETLLAASCYRNQDKLRSYESVMAPRLHTSHLIVIKKRSNITNLQFFIGDHFTEEGKSNISNKLPTETTNKNLSSQWNTIFKYIIV